MPNIGNLAVKLTADGAGFASGLDGAARKAQSFASSVKSSLSSIPFLGGAAAGLSVGGAFAWMKSGIDDISSMAKEADRLGVSLRSVAAFQVLAGASGEAMEHGLRHLNVTLGEARGGSAEAVAKFAALGVSMQDVAGLGVDQVYRRAASGIASMKDPAERAAATQQLMGRAGLELTGILSKGAGGFDKAAEAAERMGLVVKDVSDVMAAKQAIKELELALRGFKIQAGSVFARPLAGVSMAIGDLLSGHLPDPSRHVNDMRNAGMAEQAEAAGMKNAKFAAEVDKVHKTLQMQSATLNKGAEAHQIYALKTEAATAAQKKMVEQLEKEARAVDAQQVFTKNLTPLEQFSKQMEELNRLHDELDKKSPSAYGRAVGSAFQTLAGAGGHGQSQLPGAVSFGSQEALGMIARFESQVSDPQARVAQVLAEMREYDKARLETQRLILEALRSQGFVQAQM
jgi:hypothetical protein